MASQYRPSTQVGVLDKAVALLSVFSTGDSALLPAEMAARTAIPLPTVYRLAHALCAHGLLEQQGPRFRLGLTLMRLGELVAEGMDLRRQVLPHMHWLNARSGENAELQIRRGETRVAIEVVRSMHNLRPFSEIGNPMPIHLGAAGKVLLAWLPLHEREPLMAQSAIRFGDRYPLDALALRTQLAETRQRGWAFSDGERSPGLAALAAPVFNQRGETEAALILAAPSVRLTPAQREAFVPLVCEAALAASRALGYAGQHHTSDSATTRRPVASPSIS